MVAFPFWIVVLFVKVFHHKGMANPNVCEPGSATAREFSQLIHNYTISGPVFSTITAANPRGCEMECHLAVPDVCSMFNYYPDTRVCELLYKDRPAEYKVIKNNSAMFKTRKCVNNRCHKGEKCFTVSDDKDSMYHCMCGSTICSRYSKLNTKPVCFGAKGDSYGSFYIGPVNDTVVKFVFVHVIGGVTGIPKQAQGKWGQQLWDNNGLQLFITDSKKRIIFPAKDMPVSTVWGAYSYRLPNCTVLDPELMLPNFSSPIEVAGGQEFQIWFAPDLFNNGEEDNQGTSCCDVYAYYLQ